MACTRISWKTDDRAPLRLRVPAGLAVALLGASTTVALSFGGCNDAPIPDPVDAGQISKYQDARTTDGSTDDGQNLPVVDGGVEVDGSVEPTSDAEVPVDAYVPPDTPDQ